MARIALALPAVGALWLVACDDDADEQPAARTEAAPARKSCGGLRIARGYPAVKIQVMEGSVPCRVALRLVTDVYTNRFDRTTVPGLVRVGSWRCVGPEALKDCETKRGRHQGRIRARFYAGRNTDRACCLRTFVDREAGLRFVLQGRALTVRLLATAPNATGQKVRGERIRATCGQAFAESPGPGPLPGGRQTRTGRWPAGRERVRFRFPQDNSRVARWCRLEHPANGHVAFVKFR